MLGYPILGAFHDIGEYSEECAFIVGIGDSRIRKVIVERTDMRWYTAIHPKAVIARDVSIGEGSAVMAGAIINTDSRIALHCIISTGATVDHDNAIDDYVHLSPGVHLAGGVSVGAATWIGMGCSVINGLSICGGCTIGAGAVVGRDIDEPGTYAGMPARRIR